MNYQEFLTNVKTQLADRVSADVKLEIHPVIKNNGRRCDGLIIMQPDLNVSPTIYLQPYYHRYLEGVCLEDIYNDILSSYQNHLPKKDFDTSIFTDYSRASSRIVMRLVNYKKNEELLEDVPYYRFQDLAVIFYCMLHADHSNQANILIHNHHLDLWKVSVDELRAVAKKNTPLLLPPEFLPMQSLLKEHHSICDIPMYVMSNYYRTNGAAVILYEQMLKQTADMLQKNLVILPSSIHEVILIPVESADSATLAEYTQMVREVNESQLADDEILSDHAYYFNRRTQMITS